MQLIEAKIEVRYILVVKICVLDKAAPLPPFNLLYAIQMW